MNSTAQSSLLLFLMITNFPSFVISSFHKSPLPSFHKSSSSSSVDVSPSTFLDLLKEHCLKLSNNIIIEQQNLDTERRSSSSKILEDLGKEEYDEYVTGKVVISGFAEAFGFESPLISQTGPVDLRDWILNYALDDWKKRNGVFKLPDGLSKRLLNYYYANPQPLFHKNLNDKCEEITNYIGVDRVLWHNPPMGKVDELHTITLENDLAFVLAKRCCFRVKGSKSLSNVACVHLVRAGSNSYFLLTNEKFDNIAGPPLFLQYLTRPIIQDERSSNHESNTREEENINKIAETDQTDQDGKLRSSSSGSFKWNDNNRSAKTEKKFAETNQRNREVELGTLTPLGSFKEDHSKSGAKAIQDVFTISLKTDDKHTHTKQNQGVNQVELGTVRSWPLTERDCEKRAERVQRSAQENLETFLSRSSATNVLHKDATRVQRITEAKPGVSISGSSANNVIKSAGTDQRIIQGNVGPSSSGPSIKNVLKDAEAGQRIAEGNLNASSSASSIKNVLNDAKTDQRISEKNLEASSSAWPSTNNVPNDAETGERNRKGTAGQIKFVRTTTTETSQGFGRFKRIINNN